MKYPIGGEVVSAEGKNKKRSCKSPGERTFHIQGTLTTSDILDYRIGQNMFRHKAEEYTRVRPQEAL